MKKSLVLSTALVGLLSGCATVASPTTNIAEPASPPVQLVTSTERDMLSCYSDEEWNVKAPIRIAVRKIRDETGKATYGDYGEGQTFPSDNITMGMATMQLAARTGSRSPLVIYPRGKDFMDTIVAEGSARLRDNSTVDVANMSYYYNATVSGADSIEAWVAKAAVGPVGGGPSQQRYKVTMDIVLEDWRHGNAVYSTSVEKQFVQQELQAIFSDITSVFGGDRKLITAQLESVKRSMMQGVVRKLIEGGTLAILKQLPGSPSKCNSNVNKYFALRGTAARA